MITNLVCIHVMLDQPRRPFGDKTFERHDAGANVVEFIDAFADFYA